MPDSIDTSLAGDGRQLRTSLGIASARNLATTTKTVPQDHFPMAVAHSAVGAGVGWRLPGKPPVELSVSPPPGCGADHSPVIECSFVQSEVEPGEVIVGAGQPAGGGHRPRQGEQDRCGQVVLALLASGSEFGDAELAEPRGAWDFTVKAVTGATVLTLTRRAFEVLVATHPALATQLEQFRARPALPQNKHGEADIELASGPPGPVELSQSRCCRRRSPTMKSYPARS
jgi:hypothetical protein